MAGLAKSRKHRQPEMAGWVNMELDDEEKLDALMPMPMARPDYPCGLKLCFDRISCKKLDLDEMPKVGELLDMRCFMEVMNVSDGPGGPCFEAQITMIRSPVENEDTEAEMGGDDEADEPQRRRARLYG